MQNLLQLASLLLNKSSPLRTYRVYLEKKGRGSKNVDLHCKTQQFDSQRRQPHSKYPLKGDFGQRTRIASLLTFASPFPFSTAFPAHLAGGQRFQIIGRRQRERSTRWTLRHRRIGARKSTSSCDFVHIRNGTHEAT